MAIVSTSAPVVLAAEEIDALPLVEFGPGSPGVTHRVLWHNETSIAGVMYVGAGCRLGRHAHRVNHHHLWVLDGEVSVLDRVVGAGSYVHVPAGCEHDLDASATGGATVFYLYLRVAV
jgi:quercetin dioxygenase-like cupin family protein